MKLVKKALITVIMIIGIFIILSCGYLFKTNIETRKMHPSDTKEVVDGIYTIKDDFVNMYLIKNNGGYIAIDAGVSKKNVESEINKLKLDANKVTAVFLTHTDSDHTGALKLFKNATIYISSAEEQMINGKTARMYCFVNNRINTTYKMLSDNQELNIGELNVKGILTPGHTPGSMSYIINGKYLFTGDTLSLNNGKAELFNKFFNMDSVLEEKSIKKLSALSGVEYIFTGHYSYTNNFQKAFKS